MRYLGPNCELFQQYELYNLLFTFSTFPFLCFTHKGICPFSVAPCASLAYQNYAFTLLTVTLTQCVLSLVFLCFCSSLPFPFFSLLNLPPLPPLLQYTTLVSASFKMAAPLTGIGAPSLFVFILFWGSLFSDI